MGEGIGDHIALAARLQPVIADRRGGIQTFLYIALFEDFGGASASLAQIPAKQSAWHPNVRRPLAIAKRLHRNEGIAPAAVRATLSPGSSRPDRAARG